MLVCSCSIASKKSTKALLPSPAGLADVDVDAEGWLLLEPFVAGVEADCFGVEGGEDLADAINRAQRSSDAISDKSYAWKAFLPRFLGSSCTQVCWPQNSNL